MQLLFVNACREGESAGAPKNHFPVSWSSIVELVFYAEAEVDAMIFAWLEHYRQSDVVDL
jgi:hypothetical protein